MPKRAQTPSTYSSDDAEDAEDNELVEDEASTSEDPGSESDSEEDENPTALEAVDSVVEICARIRTDVHQFTGEYKEVQTAAVGLLDIVDQEMRLLGKSIEDREKSEKDPTYNDEGIASMVLIVKDSLENLEEAISSLDEDEPEDMQSQISSVMDRIQECYQAIPGKVKSCRNERLASRINPSSSIPPLPTHRFTDRSELLRQGVEHLTSSASSPSKILISGEDGSGKTALAVQLLHNTEIQASFGDGQGCWYLDCAPFCERAARKPGGSGVVLVEALLRLMDIALPSSEKDSLGFLYKKLVAMGARMKILLVLDGLTDVVSPKGQDDEGLTMKKVIEKLGSLHCVSLLVISGDEDLRPLLPWTLLLPKDGLGPLELTSAVEMFEAVLEVENIDPPPRDDTIALLDFQPTNRLPLGIMLLARMQKFHDGPADTHQHLEEVRDAPENKSTSSSEGLGLIFQMVLNSVVSKTKTVHDAPRLLALVAFLPEGLPNYIEVLTSLTSPDYLNFDVLFEPEASPDMLLKVGLVEKNMDAQGTEALVVQRTVKKYFSQPSNQVLWFSDDLYTLLRFIDNCRTDALDLALSLGSTNIYRVLQWALMYKACSFVAQVALECCSMLFDEQSIMNEDVISLIYFVHKAVLESAEQGELGYHIHEERKNFLAFLLRYATWAEESKQSEDAREVARNAIKMAESVGDQVALGHALTIQGRAFQQDNYLDQAYASFDRASKIFESYGETQECAFARALNGMASIDRRRGRYTEAIKGYERAIALYKKHSKIVSLGEAVCGLGATLRMVDREGEALERYDEVVKLATECHNNDVAATALNNMGAVLVNMDQHEVAMEKFECAYEMFSKVPDRLGMAGALDNVAGTLRSTSRFEEAIEKHQEAYTIYMSLDDPLGTGTLLNNWAITLKKLNRIDDAAKKFEDALAIFEPDGFPEIRANTLENYGAVLTFLKRDTDAISAFREASAIFARLKIVNRATKSKWMEAIVYEASGHKSQAIEIYYEAAELYRSFGLEEGAQNTMVKIRELEA